MDELETPVVPTWTAVDTTPKVEPPPARTRGRRRKAAAAIVGSLLVGGAAGAALFGPLTAAAASPSASSSTALSTVGGHDPGPGGRGGFGGPHETVTDTSVVAKAIGISEADLITALQGGQTPAQVAKAHNVDVQKVIDALVADGLSELADQVKAGTITQAQADTQKTAVTQRATDQANGTLMGGPGGRGDQPAPSANP